MTHLLLLAGRRKVGKDTTAAILKSRYGAHVDAFADGFKAFAARAFDLPAPWVWGPSELREQKIPGLDRAGSPEWRRVYQNVQGGEGFRWLVELLGDYRPGMSEDYYRAAALRRFNDLCAWVDELRTEAERNGGLTVRHLLQQLGTEFGRMRIADDVWAVTGARRALRIARGSGAQLAVILDGRFANEVDDVRHKQGGRVLRLVDPHAPPPDPSEHVSERELDKVPPEWFDAVLHNDKALGVAHLEREIRAVVPLLFPDVKELT